MGTTGKRKMIVEVPERLAAEFADASDQMLVDFLLRGLRDFRIEQAIKAYRQGDMSFAAAAELAAVSQADLARAAYVRGMYAPFDEEMIAEELT